MRLLLLQSLFILSLAHLQANDDLTIVDFDWGNLGTIPPAIDHSFQPGVAGPFTGIQNNALIVAGGANFPNGPAWEGGGKVFHRDIYILEKKENGDYEWIEERHFALPERVAYGVSIGTDLGLICLGGFNGNELLDKAFIIKWNDVRREIELEDLPPLPEPLANMSGDKIDNNIYVAGSNEANGTKHFWVLNLEKRDEGWRALPVWAGSPRTHALGLVQNNGETDCFYLLKGRFRGNDTISTLLTDGFVYNPKSNEWKELEIGTGAAEFSLSAGTGLASGANHILLFGGADGKLLNQFERFAHDIEATEDTYLQQNLTAERDTLQKYHPGFSKDIWAFHTITQTWSKVGELPIGSQVTTTALMWDDQIIIPSGEIAPCVRTPEILSCKITNNVSFGTVNYIVLFIYLVLLVGLGFIFSKNQHNTNDFFKGGNRIPWWAAGLSIFGTQLSAITFMAIPAKTFATDWLYFMLMMTIIMVSPFIIRYFLPFYRRFNLTTAYEYLELRFNLWTRLIGSTMYIFLQLGRLGIVLLLPSLALSVVTGIDVSMCILTMGILSVLYTVLGGIEAVIWTDVLQVVVLLGGALLSTGLLFFNLDSGDLSTYISTYDKMKIFDFELSFSNPTLWVVLIGGFASNLVQYGSDQTVIQRYLTTRDEKSAARAIRIGAWLALPSTLIFFTLGTLLFVHYKVSPELLNPVLEKTDTIFPWYIINSLPQGVSGLLIAAVFAASMSSLDSSMNSVATVITTDFVRRLRPLGSEAVYLNVARKITIGIGVMGTGLALVMATWGISSLWDQFNMIIGLFAGGLGGIFVLGIFSRTTTDTGALVGLVVSGIVQIFIKESTNIHLLMYASTGMFTSIVVGYMASKFLGDHDDRKMQYTYFSLKKISSF